STELAVGQQRYLMPVRLRYADDQHTLIGAGPHQVQAMTKGPGGFEQEVSWTVSTVSALVNGPSVSQSGALLVDQPTLITTAAQRRQLLTDSHEALWSILLDLEQRMAKELNREHAKMRSEIYDTIGRW